MLKKEFQEFVQQDEGVHELFDWLDFGARRGLTSFGKIIAKFDKRELGGITFRLKQTSKNFGTYRFYREGEGELPIRTSLPESATKSEGRRDIEGHFHHADIHGKNSDEKNKNENQLTAAHIAEGKNSHNVPTSLNGVFCSLRSDLDRIAPDLTGAARIALDIETYGERKGDGLDPWKGDIRLLTLSRHGGTIWTIDLRAIGYELGPIKPILEEAGIIAHNAKFDLLWLRVKCGLFASQVSIARSPPPACSPPAPNPATTSTSAWNGISASSPPPITAGRIGRRCCSPMTNSPTRPGTWPICMTCSAPWKPSWRWPDWTRCGRWKARCSPWWWGWKPQASAWTVENWNPSPPRPTSQAQQATDDLRAALGNPSINPASPGQVLAALRAAGISLESTAEEALKAADDGRLIPLVLAHREASKRAQQAEALVGHIKSDNRIHGRFEPLGTATGRFSSKEPNLQNIGRGEMREAFTAPEGRRLIVADYSQIELRAAAAIAGETRMIDAYKAGADLHKLTAATVLGKDQEQVTKSDRQLAKAVNFGLLYGQSAPGLVRYAATSYGVTLDRRSGHRHPPGILPHLLASPPMARPQPQSGGGGRHGSPHPHRPPPPDPDNRHRLGTLHRAGEHAGPGRHRRRHEARAHPDRPAAAEIRPHRFHRP